MNQNQVNLLENFLTQCLEDGTYCFTIEGVNYLLENKYVIQIITDAILAASHEDQLDRIQQAEKYINTFCKIAA